MLKKSYSMRHKFIFLFINIISIPLTYSQIGIGTVNVNSSSQLEINSTAQGILVPRMNTVNRNLILQPEKGLFIYNTLTNTFNYNKGTSTIPNWVAIDNKATSTSYIKQSAKYSNTDVTTDINPTSAIDAPIFGNEIWNDNSSLFLSSSNSIRVAEGGRYNININISILSTTSSARKAPEIYIEVNGVRIGSYGSTGYMRNTNNHDRASLHLNEVLELQANDIIRVKIVNSGNTNSATLLSIGSSNFYIEKIKNPAF